MTKANITQYSSTASSNTDINDINIAENCPASGLNNAIRELMAHLKNVDTGSQALTALSVTGNVSVGGTFTSRGIDDNADALAITIDSSENVLIGKTTTALATAGLTLGSAGFASLTRSGAEPLSLNRLSSHGGIAVFYKDGTTVGQIDSSSGNLLIRTSGDTSGIRFDTNSLTPFKNGSQTDNAVDLGFSNARFKDLYLSGGVFLGGTGSANKLDDYEEGTWTVTDASGAGLTFTQTRTAQYIKVGNMVHVNAYIDFPSTSDATGILLGGLPFTPFKVAYGSGRVQSVGTSNLVFQFNEGGANIYIMHPHAVVTNATNSSQYVLFSGVYQTS